MTLPVEEFLRRFLLHLLPKRFVHIRHFGFLATRQRTAQLPICFRLAAATTSNSGPGAAKAEVARAAHRCADPTPPMQTPFPSRTIHVLRRAQSRCVSSLHHAARDLRNRTHQTPPIPKSDSNPIGPASAANAGGFVQVAVSEANRLGASKPLRTSCRKTRSARDCSGCARCRRAACLHRRLARYACSLRIWGRC